MINQSIRIDINAEGQFVLTYAAETWADQRPRDRFTAVVSRTESQAKAVALLDSQNERDQMVAFLRSRQWSCAPPGRDGTRELLLEYFRRIKKMGDEGDAFLRYEMARQGYALVAAPVPDDKKEG